ncbi:hypothetical protein F0562_002673 [Nyssa sinensis]|uniref:Uncharacterized protein n=1 Tax=Nyssa sinensis TaxID=561372 RepID=A0A5J5BUW5_9ASTE|nr:hypothetical protein F0562_002673 [Nyssa sinensis]
MVADNAGGCEKELASAGLHDSSISTGNRFVKFFGSAAYAIAEGRNVEEAIASSLNAEKHSRCLRHEAHDQSRRRDFATPAFWHDRQKPLRSKGDLPSVLRTCEKHQYLL